MVDRAIGIDSDGRFDMSLFEGHEIPFDIGSLERSALSYLGEWRKFQCSPDPYGFCYRFGVKQNVVGVKHNIVDSAGDPCTVFLHFAVPWHREGYIPSQEKLVDLEKKISMMSFQSTVIFSKILGTAVGVRANPPEYMLEELKLLC